MLIVRLIWALVPNDDQTTLRSTCYRMSDQVVWFGFFWFQFLIGIGIYVLHLLASDSSKWSICTKQDFRVFFSLETYCLMRAGISDRQLIQAPDDSFPDTSRHSITELSPSFFFFHEYHGKSYPFAKMTSKSKLILCFLFISFYFYYFCSTSVVDTFYFLESTACFFTCVLLHVFYHVSYCPLMREREHEFIRKQIF
jgi:hypothetical protein